MGPSAGDPRRHVVMPGQSVRGSGRRASGVGRRQWRRCAPYVGGVMKRRVPRCGQPPGQPQLLLTHEDGYSTSDRTLGVRMWPPTMSGGLPPHSSRRSERSRSQSHLRLGGERPSAHSPDAAESEFDDERRCPLPCSGRRECLQAHRSRSRVMASSCRRNWRIVVRPSAADARRRALSSSRRSTSFLSSTAGPGGYAAVAETGVGIRLIGERGSMCGEGGMGEHRPCVVSRVRVRGALALLRDRNVFICRRRSTFSAHMSWDRSWSACKRFQRRAFSSSTSTSSWPERAERPERAEWGDETGESSGEAIGERRELVRRKRWVVATCLALHM